MRPQRYVFKVCDPSSQMTTKLICPDKDERDDFTIYRNSGNHPTFTCASIFDFLREVMGIIFPNDYLFIEGCLEVKIRSTAVLIFSIVVVGNRTYSDFRLTCGLLSCMTLLWPSCSLFNTFSCIKLDLPTIHPHGFCFFDFQRRLSQCHHRFPFG